MIYVSHALMNNPSLSQSSLPNSAPKNDTSSVAVVEKRRCSLINVLQYHIALPRQSMWCSGVSQRLLGFAPDTPSVTKGFSFQLVGLEGVQVLLLHSVPYDRP